MASSRQLVKRPASRAESRRMERLARAMRSTARHSSGVTGRKVATASARRLATSWVSSMRTTAYLAGSKEDLRAFWEDRVLPSGERGPVDFCALRRLATRRLGERGLSFGMAEG